MDQHQQRRVAIEELLGSLGLALGELTGGAPSVLDTVQTRYWASYHSLRKRLQEGTLSLAVLALTKSGKSTLLNALVGKELLPMNNVPETARISKIVHTPDANEPYLVEFANGHATSTSGSGSSSAQASAVGTVTARGEAAVRSRLQTLNQAVRGSGPLLKSPSAGLRVASQSVLQHSNSSSSALAPAGIATGHLATNRSSTESTLGVAQSGTGSGSLDEGADGTLDTAALHLPSPSSFPVATGLPLDKLLTIHAPVAALMEYEVGPSAAKDAGVSSAAAGLGSVKLQLLDTPGPNEAGEEELRHQVERLLDGVDAVLYLLDYTKLKTQDEAGMFERLRNINPSLVQRLSQRLFFVVNKVDAALVSEGQDLDVTREYVAELVTQQMGLEGFALRPDQVLLLSARNALLSRLVLTGSCSHETRARFVQLAFGRFANPAVVTQDQMAAAAQALLMDSGILDLESQVLAYLYNHAAAVKQLALVDDMGRLMVEVRNVATSCTAALSASAEALAARVEEVKAQLQATVAQFEAVQRDTDNIGHEVAKEVRAHLHTLRGRLFSAIINALDTSGGPDLLPPSTSDAGMPFLSRGWQTVRERFLSIFTGRRGGGACTNISNGGGSVAYYSSADGYEGSSNADLLGRCDSAALLNAAGGAVARSRSKQELAALLVNLHEELTAQVHAEVREFWGVMETVASARHAELLATVNTHLAALSRQVEGVVSHSLEVQLSPVTLKLAEPDASQFHANLDKLLAKGMVETRERHIRVNQKEVVEKVLRRGGICRWGDYWESVPRVRTVVEAYTLSVYELVPSEISQHFITMVDTAIDSTQASLEAYVSQFVGQQLQEARQQLQTYSQTYLGIMGSALEANTQGSTQRINALQQVRSFLDRVTAIHTQFNVLQRDFASGMPRALEAMIAYDDLSDVVESEESEPMGQDGEGVGEGAEQAAGEQQGADQEVSADVDGAHGLQDHSLVQEAGTLTSPFAQHAEGLAASLLRDAAEAAQVESASTADVVSLPASPFSPVDSPAAAADATSRASTAVLMPELTGADHTDHSSVPVSGTPRSPTSQSDSSSLANALLKASLNGDGSPIAIPTSEEHADGHTTAAPAEASSGSNLSAVTSAAAAAPEQSHSSTLSLPSGPFDYASGFVNAMSSSQLQADQQAASASLLRVGTGEGSSDEWDLVERDGEGEDSMKVPA